MKRDPRLDELLAERALGGLTDAEAEALSALGGAGDESFDRAAAALELALPHDEALPPALADAILARVTGAASGPRLATLAAPRAVRAARTWPAWVAAAAAVAFAVGAWAWAASRPPVVVRVVEPAPSSVASVAPPAPQAPAEQRARLLSEANDAKRIEWKATKDPAAQRASGDVVWSNAEQKGFMRFAGLEPNDPRSTQYQLWIFDKDRDAKYPVDGGVFDVAAGGEVVVAIAAKLHVDDPTLFAVTIEKPGGVVVSKREHIVVVASPQG